MIRSVAQFLSLLFHPLLIVTYMLILLLLINPYLFGVSHIGEQESKVLIIRVFLSTFFIPGFGVAMLRFAGMVPSLELKTKEERIGPYIIAGIFYLWMYKTFQEDPRVPTAFASFMLGAVIGLFVAFFINIFSKISMHTVGVGGLLGMVVITMVLFSYDTFTVNSTLLGLMEVDMTTVLFITILIAGVVGSCRLLLNAHDPLDLYGGYLVGFTAQLVALRFVF